MSEASLREISSDEAAPRPHSPDLEPRRTFPRLEPGRRGRLLVALLMLSSFALGGCVTAWLMRNLVLKMMAIYQNPTEVSAVYNLLDHLIPFYVGFGASLLLGAIGALITALSTRKSGKRG